MALYEHAGRQCLRDCKFLWRRAEADKSRRKCSWHATRCWRYVWQNHRHCASPSTGCVTSREQHKMAHSSAQWAYVSWGPIYKISYDNQLVAWHSGRTSVSGRRTFPVLRSTCSSWVTTNVGKPSATGQPTRPTQPFILSGSIKWVVSWNQMCAAVYR